MKTTVDTYANRIEVTIAVPEGLDHVEGGAIIVADDNGSNRRAIWCFPPDADPKGAATEAARLLVSSSPGDGPDPEAEQPVKTQTVNVAASSL